MQFYHLDTTLLEISSSLCAATWRNLPHQSRLKIFFKFMLRQKYVSQKIPFKVCNLKIINEE